MKEKHGGNIHRYRREAGEGAAGPQDHSANLSPLGMPEAGREVLMRIARAAMPDASPEEKAFFHEVIEAYPDPDQRDLTLAIDRHHGGGLQAKIVCGNGAADIISRLPEALGIGSALIVCPVFSEYEESLERAGADIERYCLSSGRGFRFDEGLVERIRIGGAAGPYDAVYFCQPQNPSGVMFTAEETESVALACRESDCVLIADECFMEFVPEDERPSLEHSLRGEGLRLVILKSFTKLYAMAGLRLGYCLCSREEDAERIRACGQEWPVSTTAALVGEAVLADTQSVEKTVLYISAERERMIKCLRRAGYTVYDGRANYVLLKAVNGDGEPDSTVASRMREKGMLIRDCSNYEGLGPGYYRIAVRSREENDSLLSAFRNIDTNGQTF